MKQMKTTITLQVMVTLDVPEKYAAQVTRDDLIGMARNACPDSMTHPGPPSGVQIEVDEVSVEDADGEPVFADSYVEHDICDDPDIEFDDDGFTKAMG